MKKLLLAATIVLALALATAGVAFADGGPHGGYTPTTDACAGCHRAHTAGGARLLIVPVGELCMSCHGSTGTGADTDVLDGIFVQRDLDPGDTSEGVADRGLRGGGFAYARMDTGLTGGGAISITTTSAHTYDGAAGIAWGNGELGTAVGAGPAYGLDCTDCHDPHGNGNYRILRPIPNDSGAADPVDVPDEAAPLYTVNNAAEQYFGEGYTGFGTAASASTGDMTEPYRVLSDWCAQCHTRYMAGVNGATEDSGDSIFAFRHMTGNASSDGVLADGDCEKCHGVGFVSPPPITYNDGQFRHAVECMTCHVAHGTSASMSTDGPYSANVEWPDDTTTPDDDARSALLRVDGRGVCQGCHNKPAPAP